MKPRLSRTGSAIDARAAVRQVIHKACGEPGGIDRPDQEAHEQVAEGHSSSMRRSTVRRLVGRLQRDAEFLRLAAYRLFGALELGAHHSGSLVLFAVCLQLLFYFVGL